MHNAPKRGGRVTPPHRDSLLHVLPPHNSSTALVQVARHLSGHRAHVLVSRRTCPRYARQRRPETLFWARLWGVAALRKRGPASTHPADRPWRRQFAGLARLSTAQPRCRAGGDAWRCASDRPETPHDRHPLHPPEYLRGTRLRLRRYDARRSVPPMNRHR